MSVSPGQRGHSRIRRVLGITRTAGAALPSQAGHLGAPAAVSRAIGLSLAQLVRSPLAYGNLVFALVVVHPAEIVAR